MAGGEFRGNAVALEFAAQGEARGRMPDGVGDIDDRFEQRDEAEVAFDRGEQRADPAAVT